MTTPHRFPRFRVVAEALLLGAALARCSTSEPGDENGTSDAGPERDATTAADRSEDVNCGSGGCPRDSGDAGETSTPDAPDSDAADADALDADATNADATEADATDVDATDAAETGDALTPDGGECGRPAFVVAPAALRGELATSIASADFNGDHQPDLVLAHSAGDDVLVAFNRGHGIFDTGVTYPAGDGPVEVNAADLDADGAPDLVVLDEAGGSVTVLMNRGDGAFAAGVPYAAGPTPRAMAVRDLNADGKPDIVVANGVSREIRVLVNTGDGAFAAAVPYAAGTYAGAVAVADLDNDGKPDIAVSDLGLELEVLENEGAATFAAPVSRSIGAGVSPLMIGDFTGDGKADFVVADHGEIRVLPSAGSVDAGALSQIASSFAHSWTTSGDFNQDGKPDVLTLERLGVRVLFNDGSGSLSNEDARAYVGGSASGGFVTADFDGDGRLDVAITTLEDAVRTPQTGAVSLLFGRGEGGFAAPVSYPPLLGVFSDWNGDGKLDLVTHVDGGYLNDGYVDVWLNEPPGVLSRVQHLSSGGIGPHSVQVGDLNGDGAPDIVVANAGWEFPARPGNFAVYLSAGSGALAPVVTYPFYAPDLVRFGQFDADGKLDLVVSRPGVSLVFLNRGDGTFGSGISPVSPLLTVADFNADGYTDLVTSYFDGSVQVQLCNGDGSFAAPVAYYTPSSDWLIRGITAADLDGDDDVDLAVMSANNSLMGLGGLDASAEHDFELRVFLNRGDGTFVLPPVLKTADVPVGTNPVDLTAGDFDGDGLRDLAAAASAQWASALMLFNDGAGAFDVPVLVGPSGGAQRCSAIDLNDDGRTDLALENGLMLVLSARNDCRR